MTEEEIHALDYFVAGVPAGFLFMLDYDNMLKLVESSGDKNTDANNTLYQICLIGLVSFTEAFFKNQLASLINIHNPLVLNLKEEIRDIQVGVKDIVNFGNNISRQLGSIVSEQLDFGTASSVNSLYFELIKISPFSKDDIVRYNDLLRDRNLLVHHGGVITKKYNRQLSSSNGIAKNVYWDSLEISKQNYLEWANFILNIVDKTCSASRNSLMNSINVEMLSDAKKEALDYTILNLE